MSKWNSVVVSIFNGRYEKPQKQVCKDEVSYRTFGSHDFVTVTPIASRDKKGVPVANQANGVPVLDGMLRITAETTKNLNLGESTHHLFAVATEAILEGNEQDVTEMFWDQSSHSIAPFLFVSTVQLRFKQQPTNQKFEEYVKQINTFLMNKKGKENETFKIELNELIPSKDKIFDSTFNFVTYYSLDCCDLVLFIKTQKYKLGAMLLQYMQQKFGFLQYGYSLVGVDLEQLEKISFEQSEIIPKVVVCSVVSDAIGYKKWLDDRFLSIYPKLLSSPIDGNGEEYTHFSRLGNEDVCINIFNCRLSKLAKSLLNGGVFSHNDENLKKSCMRLRIHFDSDYINLENGLIKVEPQTDQGRITYLQIHEKYKLSDVISASVDKALMEIFTACAQLESNHFALDVLDCVISVYKTILDEIFLFKNNKDTLDLSEFNKSLIYCATGIMSIVNGCLHADRMFFQCPGFNAVIYDIPAKLLVFYTAYMHSLSYALNDENDNNMYRFLLAPDLYPDMYIEKMFDYREFKKESNLAKTRIPVDKLFTPDILMQELAHETAHMSGTSLRCRDKRYEILIEMLADTIVDRLLSCDVLNVGTNHQQEILKRILNGKEKEIANDLIKWFKEQICKDYKKLAAKENINDDRKYYRYFFIKFIKEILNDQLSDHHSSCDVYYVIESTFRKYNPHLRPNDIGAYGGMYNDRIWLINRDLHSIIDDIVTLAYESYADLVMLTVLDITEKEYLELFIRIFYTAGNLYAKDMLNFGYGERIISVLKTKFNDGKVLNAKNMNEFDNESDEYKDFIITLSKFMNDQEEEHRVLTNFSIEYNVRYLSECKEKIDKRTEQESLKSIRELYNCISTKSIVEGIEEMRKLSYDFRKDINKLY